MNPARNRHVAAAHDIYDRGARSCTASMSEERHSDVLGGLPRTRPHRRSQKRAAQPTPPPAPAPAPAPADPALTPDTGVSPDAGVTRDTAASQAAEVTPDTVATPDPAVTPDTAATPRTKSGAAPMKRGSATKPRTADARKPKAAAARPKPTAAGTTKPSTAGAAHSRPDRLRQPAQPEGTPSARRRAIRPAPPSGADVVGTAVKAAAELAEIGLSISARAIRGAVSRLPRP
jgi:hypothetical protein